LTIAGFALDGTEVGRALCRPAQGNELVYAGKVDHGFDKVSAADLRKRLEPLVRKTQAFAKRVVNRRGVPKPIGTLSY
jgi:bifunctional non-homologous end joining protein LigD